MFRRIQGFRLGVEQRRDPFDEHPDIAGQNYLFIFLTGRGEYSYLFPNATENSIVDEAARSIPMGYTQIWILEWASSIRPNPGKKIRPFQRRAAQHLTHGGVQEGYSYVLIAETGQCLGCTEKLHAAIGAANLIAIEKQVRIAVGLLKANVTWH